jgi:isoleucyl-tRNA synthetase
MKDISIVVSNLSSEDIKKLEQTGNIELVINEKSIIFEINDFEIVSQDIEGWLVAHEGSLTVALDIVIDKNLKDEGISREFVSKIQTMRKNSGFEVTDRINIFIKRDSNITDAVNNNMHYIKSETLAVDLEIVEELQDGDEISFDNIQTKISINKI